MEKGDFIKCLIMAIAFGSSCRIFSQAIIWEMPPKEVSSISRITNGLYKVDNHGKIAIVTPDGTPIFDGECSDITPFYENKALVINHESSGNHILGTISLDGKYTIFPKCYYGLQGQLFYSDGLLSVEDENGKKGYIDSLGNEQIGFNDQYKRILPFSEGYATVYYNNNKYNLINKSGKPEKIVIGIGEVSNGTNVYNGTAYIFDNVNNKWYLWDVVNKTSKACKRPQDVKQFDYLNCFSSISKRDKDPTYQSILSGNKSISPTMSQGLYGYIKDNNVLLNFQFNEATPFEDGYAIVKLGQKHGILKLTDAKNTFSVETPKVKYEYVSGQSVNCSFSVSVPDVWDTRHYDIILKDPKTGNPVAINKDGNMYSFTCMPETDTYTYAIEAVADGMLLASQNINYTFVKKKQDLQFNISLINDEAGEDGKIWVKVVVRNPNDEAIKTTITVYGGNTKFEGKTENVTLHPGQSKEIRSCFINVTKKYVNQYVTVKTSNAGSFTKDKLSFRKALHLL